MDQALWSRFHVLGSRSQGPRVSRATSGRLLRACGQMLMIAYVKNGLTFVGTGNNKVNQVLLVSLYTIKRRTVLATLFLIFFLTYHLLLIEVYMIPLFWKQVSLKFKSIIRSVLKKNVIKYVTNICLKRKRHEKKNNAKKKLRHAKLQPSHFVNVNLGGINQRYMSNRMNVAYSWFIISGYLFYFVGCDIQVIFQDLKLQLQCVSISSPYRSSLNMVPSRQIGILKLKLTENTNQLINQRAL